MKLNFVLLILLVFLLGSCDKQTCKPATVSSTFSANKAIHVSFDTSLGQNAYTIQNGDKIVFQRVYSSEDCDDLHHDEITLTLGFELPAESTHFTFQDSALVIANCFVHHIGGAWINNFYPVSIGAIEGEKLEDDTWVVRGVVKYILPSFQPVTKTMLIHNVFSQ